MKVIFLGTPDFAVPTLEALLASKHEVLAVVTQPDKPGDRNRITVPPVKVLAEKRGVPVLQFTKIRSEGVEALRRLSPDVMVTAAYGQILSQEIIDIPRFGILNVHTSLLPAYRGAAPIQWAVIKGEKKTGVTIMRTDIGVDTGDMLLTKETEIGDDETAGELFDRLKHLGAAALIEGLSLLESGKARFTPQNAAAATHFPMLRKTDGEIDWTAPAPEVHNLVRGVNPWPSAYTFCNGGILKIWKTRVAEGAGSPGTVIASDGGLTVACGGGAVEILELQVAGGRRMTAAEFLRGRPLPSGTVLAGQS